MSDTKLTADALSYEFELSDFGDQRLTRRSIQIANAAARAPSASLPQRAKTSSELTSHYRFLRNPKVTPEETLEGHVLRTVERAEACGRVLVIHDTTEFEFGGDVIREGLGVLNSEHRQGFLAHYSICTTLDGEPLGTVGLRAWSRAGEPKGRAKHTSHMAQYDPDREFLRWQEAALDAGQRLFNRSDAIHVMDREGDCYELFAALVEHEQSFVIRLQHDRRLSSGRKAGADKLFDSMGSEPVFFERDVPLTRRGNAGRGSSERKRFPSRDARLARLEVRAACRTIFIANGAPAHLPPSLTVNVVEIREVGAPDGEQPVLWRLVTTLPIDTAEQIAVVVDSYCRRWLIEEFFKALKTGCRFQMRQLETGRHLLVNLAIETAVAWHLLRLRWVAHQPVEQPAATVLSEEQLLALRLLAHARKRPLPEHPTATDVLWEVAAQGGHLRNNGNPGWLVLRRGYEKLSTAVETCRAMSNVTSRHNHTAEDVIDD